MALLASKALSLIIGFWLLKGGGRVSISTCISSNIGVVTKHAAPLSTQAMVHDGRGLRLRGLWL